MKSLSALLALFVGIGVFAACAEDPEPQSNIRPGKLQPTTGPYVSVAVDNHFHDVHPDETVSFDSSRPFVVRNEGSNLHNVTIVETGFDKDIRPGRSVQMKLEPGKYHLVCRYHADQKMTGEFTVL